MYMVWRRDENIVLLISYFIVKVYAKILCDSKCIPGIRFLAAFPRLEQLAD